MKLPIIPCQNPDNNRAENVAQLHSGLGAGEAVPSRIFTAADIEPCRVFWNDSVKVASTESKFTTWQRRKGQWTGIAQLAVVRGRVFSVCTVSLAYCIALCEMVTVASMLRDIQAIGVIRLRSVYC